MDYVPVRAYSAGPLGFSNQMKNALTHNLQFSTASAPLDGLTHDADNVFSMHPINKFLGVSENQPYLAQYDQKHRNFQLPFAYAGKSTFLGEYIVGLLGNPESSIILDDTYGFPIIRTNEQSFTWSKWKYDRALVELVPEEGPSRINRVSFEAGSATTVRRGQAIVVEHGFHGTDMGQITFFRSVKQIELNTQMTFECDCLLTMMSARPQTFRYHLKNKFRFGDKDFIELSLDVAREFASAQKSSDGTRLRVLEAINGLTNAGFTPNALYGPTMGEIFFRGTGDEMIKYSQAGPAGPARSEQNPMDIRSYQNLRLCLTREYPDESGLGYPVDHYRTRKVFGEYYTMFGPSLEVIDRERYRTWQRDIVVYNGTTDNWSRITLKEAVSNLNIFGDDGKLFGDDSPDTVLQNNDNYVTDLFAEVNSVRGEVNVTGRAKYFGNILRDFIPLEYINMMIRTSYGFDFDLKLNSLISGTGNSLNTIHPGSLETISSNLHYLVVSFDKEKVERSQPTTTKNIVESKKHNINFAYVNSKEELTTKNNAIKSKIDDDTKKLHVDLINTLKKNKDERYLHGYINTLHDFLDENVAVDGKLGVIGAKLTQLVDLSTNSSNVSGEARFLEQVEKLPLDLFVINESENQNAQSQVTNLKALDQKKIGKIQVVSEQQIKSMNPRSYHFLDKKTFQINKDNKNSVLSNDNIFDLHMKDVFHNKFDYDFGVHTGQTLIGTKLNPGMFPKEVTRNVVEQFKVGSKNDVRAVSLLPTVHVAEDDYSVNEIVFKFKNLKKNVLEESQSLDPNTQEFENSTISLYNDIVIQYNQKLIELLTMPLTKETLLHWIDNNVFFPFGILVFRPFCSFLTSTCVVGAMGRQLGFFALGDADVMISDDASIKTHQFNFTIYAKAIITNPEALYFLDDLWVNRYISGMNVNWFNKQDIDNYKRNGFSLPDDTSDRSAKDAPSIFPYITLYRDPKIQKVIDFRGKFSGHDGTGVGYHFTTTKACLDLWSNNHHMAPPHPYDPEPTYTNTVCIQAHQVSFSYVDNQFNVVKPGHGHMGRNIEPGMMEILEQKRGYNNGVLREKTYFNDKVGVES